MQEPLNRFIRLGSFWERRIIFHTDDGVVLTVPPSEVFYIKPGPIKKVEKVGIAVRARVLNNRMSWALGINWLWIRGWIPLSPLCPEVRAIMEAMAQKSPAFKESRAFYIPNTKIFNVGF